MKRSHYYCYKCTHAANQIQIIAALSSLTLHAPVPIFNRCNSSILFSVIELLHANKFDLDNSILETFYSFYRSSAQTNDNSVIRCPVHTFSPALTGNQLSLVSLCAGGACPEWLLTSDNGSDTQWHTQGLYVTIRNPGHTSHCSQCNDSWPLIFWGWQHAFINYLRFIYHWP